MIKSFADNAWEEYEYWQTKDKKILKKINTLIKDIERKGYEGLGKPEPLTHELSGYWSRRITEKDRLIYKVENGHIIIVQLRGYYDD
ncbi:MAG TPA: Txe/YoeB family addiction module toxin [Patescibacteria group bacterium]|nr:Txe/YoeB family addiction module toxin [Patescibacteria group bacterium]